MMMHGLAKFKPIIVSGIFRDFCWSAQVKTSHSLLLNQHKTGRYINWVADSIVK